MNRSTPSPGGQIAHAFDVFHYGIFPSSVAAEGVQLHGLTTWHDVTEPAHERGCFAPPQYQAIKPFLGDPESWKAPA
jgi:orotate phosphoribosyltransferase